MTLPSTPHHCSVCADAADRAKVQTLRGRDADVTLQSGKATTVAVDLIPGVRVGDTLLVHQGVAISRVATEGDNA